MEILFSGTNTQEQASGVIVVSEALQLDLDGWPVTASFAFSADPAPDLVDEFAITVQTYFNIFQLTFRNDAPHFQNGDSAAHFDITRFYWETIAHEIGHVLSGAMNTQGRTLLGRLFGVGPTPEEWFPADKIWQDRPGEAIAETFKEAFLPANYREYANRTNLILQYPYYPLFRAIFRNAVTDGLLRDAEANLGLPAGDLGSEPTVEVGDEVTLPEIPGTGIDSPAYNLDLFRQGDLHSLGGNQVLANAPGNGLRTYTNYNNTTDWYVAGSLAAIYTELDHVWSFNVVTPDISLYGGPTQLLTPAQYLALQGAGWGYQPGIAFAQYRFRVAIRPTVVIAGVTQYRLYREITYAVAAVYPNPLPDQTGVYDVILGGGLALGGGGVIAPGSTIPISFSVLDFLVPPPLTHACEVSLGVVEVESSIIFEPPYLNPWMTPAQILASNMLPSLPFVQPAHLDCGTPGGTTGGLPINTLPLEPGVMVSTGADSNDHRVKHRVSGSAV